MKSKAEIRQKIALLEKLYDSTSVPTLEQIYLARIDTLRWVLNEAE